MLNESVAWLCRGLAHRLNTIATAVNPPPPPSPPPPPVPPPLIAKTEKELAHEKWVNDDGDRTLRVDYPLRRQDVVLDVGGYRGQWASDIFSRYLCQIHIFEPVPQFGDEISRRFALNPAITLHRVAAGSQNGHIDISVAGDASSTHSAQGQSLAIPVIRFSDWLDEAGTSDIALMKINIEGGEYDLLEHLIASGSIKKISNIQVQFHDFVEGAEVRMALLQDALSKTHRLTYQYKFVWENWEKIGDRSWS